jgi:hypothetical protein
MKRPTDTQRPNLEILGRPEGGTGGTGPLFVPPAGPEKARRDVLATLRELIETLPQLVWTCQPDGACDYLSPQWVAYTGVPAERHLGFAWLEAIHPADKAATVAGWSKSAAEKRAFDVEFRVRRDLIVDGLNAIPGIRSARPSGAFYAFPDISGTSLSGAELAEKLLHEAGVCVLPGTAFGGIGTDHIRISYANTRENLRLALDRIRRVVEPLVTAHTAR